MGGTWKAGVSRGRLRCILFLLLLPMLELGLLREHGIPYDCCGSCISMLHFSIVILLLLLLEPFMATVGVSSAERQAGGSVPTV